MKSLEDATKLRLSALYKRIQGKKRDLGFTVTREQAAALLAAEYGIDISKFLKPEELSELRRLQTQTPQVVKKVVSRKGITQPKIIQLASGLQVQDPFLSSKILREAVEMRDVYPVIYIFENSVRNIISLVLKKKYGEKWWDTRVKPKIQDKVKDRMDKEAANRWHGRRGSAPIFYTDISDLLSIIMNNWTDFVNLFPDQDWIKSRIKEIEMSRNIVAHNNPLARRDIERISVYFEDWADQLRVLKDKI